MPDSKSLADVQINKSGPSGRPTATVLVDPGVPFDKLAGALQREITRNTGLRRKLGLKACLGCISGMDLDIHHRFDLEMRVDLEQIG
jgi:hypothetical protein